MREFDVTNFNPNDYDTELEVTLKGERVVIFYFEELEYDYYLTPDERAVFKITGYKLRSLDWKTDEEEEDLKLTDEEKEALESRLIEFVDWCEWISCQEPDPDADRD